MPCYEVIDQRSFDTASREQALKDRLDTISRCLCKTQMYLMRNHPKIHEKILESDPELKAEFNKHKKQDMKRWYDMYHPLHPRLTPEQIYYMVVQGILKTP